MIPSLAEPLPGRRAILFATLAVICFHAAYSLGQFIVPQLLVVGYVICLVQLARVASARASFYLGLSTALLCFAPQLTFFWSIFGPAATVLWLILAFWIALFVAVTQITLARSGVKCTALLIPFLWTGLEYFRSELYYLKFSWLNASYALTGWEEYVLPYLGMYGVGFAIAASASAWLALRPQLAVPAVIFVLLVLAKFGIPKSENAEAAPPTLRIAGVQLEFPSEHQVLSALDRLIAAHTDAELVVLSEYTLDGPVPSSLIAWCKKNGRYLILGGKNPTANGQYFNTAFVVSPAGEIIFRQAKSVPIPFFNDGLPAPSQAVWNSPWGKIGICICYDLSYTRVTDVLIRQGAQFLVVPTMDVIEWGVQEHTSNARVAPVRAAEYGVPIFRLASSGISEAVTGRGQVVASTNFPGENEILFATFHLPQTGSLPLDRWLGPFSVIIVILVLLAHLLWPLLARRAGRRRPALAA